MKKTSIKLMTLFLLANSLHGQLTDIRNFLAGLEFDVAYSRVTQIPLIQFNLRKITDYFDDNSPFTDLPLFYSQEKAWASMGTYFFNFFNADPNEMNFPALDLMLKYRSEKYLSYVRMVVNPFFSQNQRIFYLYGKTGVDKIDDQDDFFYSSAGAYAHAGFIGAEDVTLIERFYKNHLYGSPDPSVFHYGLGYVMAGSGFQIIGGIGMKKNWRLSTRLYFELNAFLPFVPTLEIGLDQGFEVNINRDLAVFIDVKLIKSFWQSAGASVGLRFNFQTLSDLLNVLEQEENLSEQPNQVPQQQLQPAQEDDYNSPQDETQENEEKKSTKSRR